MRSCIFVDGENLRHSLVDLFKPEFGNQDYLPKNAKWAEFFDFLASSCYSSTRLRSYWYVVERLNFSPWLPSNDIPKLVSTLSSHKPFDLQIKAAAKPVDEAKSITAKLDAERSKMEKRFEGWKTVQEAIASVHDAIEFRPAGTIRYNLFTNELGKEKAVDVKLAVDLLHLIDIYDVAIIVSGDGDYVPAVQAIKDRGKRVVNVSFESRGGQLLPGGARSLNQVTDKVLKVSYAQVKHYVLPSTP